MHCCTNNAYLTVAFIHLRYVLPYSELVPSQCFSWLMIWVMIEQLISLACGHCAISDEQDEHSKIEELHKRRNFLASYCKLIVYSMLPTSCAAEVFKHYVKVSSSQLFVYQTGYLIIQIIKLWLNKKLMMYLSNCFDVLVKLFL